MTETNESYSYKFQRLRERIREAITSGELAGKLPGERALAKQFQVNAKTLSKALTDLAAEGVLDRSIGRGTYVKGQAPAATVGRWLVLADPDTSPDLIAALHKHNDGLHVMTESVDRIRPSFINQYCAVIDLASETPELFLRDLSVRNIPVVAVGREPKTYSMNAVVVDSQLGATRLARDLVTAGHRRFAVAADRNDGGFVQTIRQVVTRFDPAATVDVFFASEIPAAVEAGATAVICDSSQNARQVMSAVAATGRSVAIAAVGSDEGGIPCTGYFVKTEQIASAVADLIAPAQSSRPAVLWLAGESTDRGTTVSNITGDAERTYTTPRPIAPQA